jgi:hypothetical protein
MTTALEGVEWSAARPGRTLSPGKPRYPLYRRLGGSQGRSGQVRKISPPPGFDPRTVQAVVSPYTDWATGPTTYTLTYLLIPWSRVLPEKPIGSKVVKKFAALHGTRRFITAFTAARRLFLSGSTPVRVHTLTFHFPKIHLNIILPSTPGSSKWSLFLRFSH